MDRLDLQVFIEENISDFDESNPSHSLLLDELLEVFQIKLDEVELFNAITRASQCKDWMRSLNRYIRKNLSKSVLTYI